MTFATFSVLLPAWAAVAVVMAGLWAVQRRSGDAGIVDVGWAASLGAAGIAVAAFGDGDPLRRALAGAMIGLWGLRLAGYLFADRLGKDHEDGRYVNLRHYWGERAQPWFFVFFQAQAVIVVLFLLPLAAATANPRPLGLGDVLAVFIWLVSVGGESLADRRLSRFRSDPANRGKTCREGLWRYSRHPNYFFEWLHWWAYVALAASADGWSWLVALLGPVLMLVFLYRLTGIPYTEAQALKSRGDDYREYQRTTSAFFPWFPRSSA